MSAMIHGGHGGDSPELKFANAYQPKIDPDSPGLSGPSKEFTHRTRTTPRDEDGFGRSEIGRRCWECECPSGYIPHTWRKTCSSCKCPKDSHDLLHDEWLEIRDRLGLLSKDATDPFQRLTANRPSHLQGYTWLPPNLNSTQVAEFYKDFQSDNVPKVGTPGEVYRDRQILHQIPKQDLALAYCKHVDKEHHSAYEDFVNTRNEIALDVGFVAPVSIPASSCEGCRKPILTGQLGVFAPKFGEDAVWHPACFQCFTCNQPLVDLTYCKFQEALSCERHYAEQIHPRCHACDELIFSGEFTKAMNKDWHSTHFCCWQCDESLTGQRYVLREEHPYCIRCYESVFANTCDECQQLIGIDSKDLSYKEKHWHETCFLCSKCKVSLVDKQFGSKAEKIYCSNCYDAQFASRCDGCGEVFRAALASFDDDMLKNLKRCVLAARESLRFDEEYRI
ncbi:Prickle-like protein 3 [Folsomia candida]|uniref:Prickle-like protein 3 n=1 Tax=Folsomia candida TaxID=158441 RepID=A0A226DYV7_FOLCA|nr:Prickle-like protein 3 [Folsomia candida]